MQSQKDQKIQKWEHYTDVRGDVLGNSQRTRKCTQNNNITSMYGKTF